MHDDVETIDKPLIFRPEVFLRVIVSGFFGVIILAILGYHSENIILNIRPIITTDDIEMSLIAIFVLTLPIVAINSIKWIITYNEMKYSTIFGCKSMAYTEMESAEIITIQTTPPSFELRIKPYAHNKRKDFVITPKPFSSNDLEFIINLLIQKGIMKKRNSLFEKIALHKGKPSLNDLIGKHDDDKST